MWKSGRPRITTQQQDRYIISGVLRNRRLNTRMIQARVTARYGRRISYQTIRRRLHAGQLRSRRAARKPLVTVLHRTNRLRWCRQHRPWNLARWRSVMFSDESRFCLKHNDARIRVWRRRGERFADCCVDRVTPFGGGSVMVLGGYFHHWEDSPHHRWR